MRAAVFMVSAAASLVAHLAIVASVIRARRIAADPGVRRPRFGVELMWAIVPALVLALVLTATWSTITERRASVQQPIMQIAR